MNVEVNEEALVARLRTEDPSTRSGSRSTENLKTRLMSFETHRYLTPEEEVERKRIQKLKLAAKDRMMEIIRRTRVGRA